MGDKYLKMLESCEASVSRNVTTNLYDRHIKPLFIG
jgi:tagaturonate epimerase